MEVKCECCKEPFFARVADRKRGWARFCSKSCKAIKQEQRTHQCRNHHMRAQNSDTTYYGEHEFYDAHLFSNEEHDCNKDW